MILSMFHSGLEGEFCLGETNAITMCSELFSFPDQVSPLLTGKQFLMIPSIMKSGLETMPGQTRETGAMTGPAMLIGQGTLIGGGRML